MDKTGMSKQIDEARWVRQAAPAQVDEICHMARRMCQRAALTEKECFAIELLLREALNNAVSHGCKCDPTLKVTCRLQLGTDGAIIEVHDPGAGFDWRQALARPHDDRETHGRGLKIYRAYATSIRFSESGNQITLKRLFGRRKNVP